MFVSVLNDYMQNNTIYVHWEAISAICTSHPSYSL